MLFSQEYQVGHCDTKDQIENECSPIIRQEQILQTNGAQEIQNDKVFFFRTFPRHSAEKPFTIAIFGDMGLRKPDEQGIFDDREGSYWKHADQVVTLPDTLAPHAMESLMSLVHPGYNDEHPVRKSHLNERSSGLRMTNVQLILHIGDIAYDMQEYRMKKKFREEDEDEVYNLGDRFMQVIEDIAAYVPYMVVAGNHENEEKSAAYHNGEREKPSSEKFEPQFEHFESRFQMPRNFKGHNTSQYYDFTYGPIWFICASTEYYYSYIVRKPSFRWMPDWDNVIKQYEFIERSLKKANENRQKYPWIVVLQHRPFYCTSVNKVTCRFNKSHKHGLPSEDDPRKLVYGLEELFNKYNVDLVITGHEHTFELFPPIELVDGRPKVVPDKFLWKVQRDVRHIDEDNQELVDTRHVFKTFTDPVAPVYLVVGRPGNAEEMEKLYPVPWLQRLTYYNRFSFTLLHFPFDVTQTKSTIALRQIDIETGDVPVELFLEKTFANYDTEVLCAELEHESKFRMGLSNLTKKRVQKRRNMFTRRRRKMKGKKQQSNSTQAEMKKSDEKHDNKGENVEGLGEEQLNTKGMIRELLYALNGMGQYGENKDERRETILRLKRRICENKNSGKEKAQKTLEEEKEKEEKEEKRKEKEEKEEKRKEGKTLQRQDKPISKEMLKEIEREIRAKEKKQNEKEKSGTNQREIERESISNNWTDQREWPKDDAQSKNNYKSRNSLREKEKEDN